MKYTTLLQYYAFAPPFIFIDFENLDDSWTAGHEPSSIKYYYIFNSALSFRLQTCIIYYT